MISVKFWALFTTLVLEAGDSLSTWQWIDMYLGVLIVLLENILIDNC